jgi:hypothetical protein
MYRPHIVTLNHLVTQVNGVENTRGNIESPMQTVFRWAFRKATNPLDKVYGFLGLFPPGTLKRSGTPNYNLPAATVYAMFTVDMIECEKDLHPIALWNANHFQHSTPNMPTWAFDMSNPGREFVDLAVRMTPVASDGDDSLPWYLIHSYAWYNASAGSEIVWDTFSFDATTGCLNLTGQLLDELRIVCAPLESSEPQTKAVTDQQVIQHIEDWRQQINHAYLDGQFPDNSRGPISTLDIFWRGLIGNLVGNNLEPERHATEEDIATMQHFVATGAQANVCQEIFATMTYRTVALTASGRLVFCPRHSCVGDEVWLLDGGKVPFVLEPQMEKEGKGKGEYRFIGPAYVDGIMDGQAWRDGKSKNIVLV